MTQLIYKILTPDQWAEALAKGEFDGAPVDLADGYVHISTAEQVEETASKHFAGETGLKLLALESDALGDKLVWEPSRGGALFPHLYRPLKTEDVVWVRDLPQENGAHNFDGLLD